MSGRLIEGLDRLGGVLRTHGYQMSDPIDLKAQLLQPLRAHRRGQQLRSQVHSPNYVHWRRHTGLEARHVLPERPRNFPASFV